MEGDIIIDGVKYLTYTGMLKKAESLIKQYNEASAPEKEKLLAEIERLYEVFVQRQKGLGVGTFIALDVMKERLEALLGKGV